MPDEQSFRDAVRELREASIRGAEASHELAEAVRALSKAVDKSGPRGTGEVNAEQLARVVAVGEKRNARRR